MTEVLTDPVTQTSTPPTTEDPLTEVLTEQSPQYATKEEALEKGGFKGFVDWASQQPTDFDIWLSKTPIHYQKAYREQGPEKQKEIRETFTETTKPKLGKPTGDGPGGEFSPSPELLKANPDINPNDPKGLELLELASRLKPGGRITNVVGEGRNAQQVTLYSLEQFVLQNHRQGLQVTLTNHRPVVPLSHHHSKAAMMEPHHLMRACERVRPAKTV